MDKELKLFNDYVSLFDMSDENIIRKISHSIRVMEYAKMIAKQENMSESDIYIAALCGLLHDIGRFKQWTIYQTYYDHSSIDHGDLGFDILDSEISKYTGDLEIQKIVKLSTKYHNKCELPNTIEDKYMKFINITRDADKIDIMLTQALELNDNSVIDLKSLEEIKAKSIVKNTDGSGITFEILRMLSWIFDINYDYSLKYLLKRNVFNKKLELLEQNCDKKLAQEVRKEIESAIKERLEC